MKRSISLLIIFSLILPCFSTLPVNANSNEIWDGSCDTSWSGEGTEANPYLISTPEELAGLAYNVNKGTSYSNKYFLMTNDIYLNDTRNYSSWDEVPPANQWTPIGGHDISMEKNNTYNFEGIFNGNNHTVYGMYYLNNNLNYVGLFGYVQNATISNVKISKSYIKGNSYVGGMVGYAVTKDIYSTKDYKEKTSILNCYTSIKVNGIDSYIGGVVGYLYIDRMAYIENGDIATYIDMCSNTDDIIGNSYVGGIVGYADIYSYPPETMCITKCFNTAMISGDKYVGGIVGSAKHIWGTGKEIYIKYCFNSGDIVGNTYIGGINGWNHFARIENCFNNAEINGDSYVGGITGFNEQASWISGNENDEIKYCYNVGDISAKSFYGGIVGDSETRVLSCYYLVSCVDSTNNYGYSMTESQMKTEAFYSGYDFVSVWDISSNINDGYPYLRWGESDSSSSNDSIQNAEFNPYHVSLSYPKKYLMFVDDKTLPGTPSQSKKEYVSELYEWAKEFGYDNVLTKEKVSEIIIKNMPTALYADESIALTADEYTTLEVMRDVIILSSAKNSINQWENEYLINAEVIDLTETQEKIGKIISEYSEYVNSVERNPIVTALYTVYSSKMVQLAGKSVYKVAKKSLKENYIPDVLSEGGIEELYNIIVQDVIAWQDSGIASISGILEDTWEDIKSKSLKQVGKDSIKQLIKEIMSYNDSAEMLYDSYDTISSYAKGFKSTSLIAQFAPQILFEVQLLKLGSKIMETISDVKDAQYFMINYYFKHNYSEVYDQIIDNDGNVIEYMDWIMLINSSFNSSEFAESLMSKWYGSHASLSDETKLKLMNLAATTTSIQEQNINAMRKNIVEYWANEINEENDIDIYQVQYCFNKADSFDIVDSSNIVLGSYSALTGYYSVSDSNCYNVSFNNVDSSNTVLESDSNVTEDNIASDNSYYNVSLDGETNAVIVTTLDPTIKVRVKHQTTLSVVTVVTDNNAIYSKCYVNTENSNNIIYGIQDDNIIATDENGNVIDFEAEYKMENSIVALDRENLDIRYAEHENASSVCSNIELDSIGVYGSTVKWYSSNENIISSDGTVNRQRDDTEVTLTAEIIYGNTSVSKKFKLIVLSNLITVTYDFCGENVITSQNITVGQTIPLPTEPKRKGYSFDGWYYDLDYEYPFSVNNTASENITLYAKWVEEEIYFDEVLCSSEDKEHNYIYVKVNISEKLQNLGGKFIIGLYDNDKLITSQILSNDSNCIECDFQKIPLSDCAYTVKVFCVSDLETFEPLCEVISIIISDEMI